ncbi:unnamed protein product, partial [Brugia pahangi]|uniref:RWD domain-containing protein n=1 Tax=Brugia pahangi TaxID=6280 RepID=A0A0N4U004_BRUPA
MAVVDDTDRKDQLNEIQALESIYSGTPEWFSYRIDNDSQIKGRITVVLPKIDDGIAVHADGKIIYVYYLPPLLLFFTFPQDYPSHSMPLFSLHASWLGSATRQRLREILINSWTNYLGMPILFTWIELLKEEAMQIVLSQKNVDLNKIVLEEDENEAFGKASAELLKTFIEFNDQSIQNDFENEWYDCEVVPSNILIIAGHLLKDLTYHYCPGNIHDVFYYAFQVCFSLKSGKECIRFMPCGHVFCMECTSDYYRQKLHDNSVYYCYCLCLIQQLQCLNSG